MDKRVPPTWQVRTAEQEILHHHRIAPRLFQRRHPLRTTTRYLRYENLHNKQSLNSHSLLAWIFVSPAMYTHPQILTNVTTPSCTVLAVLRIDCAIDVFGDVSQDPIGASWWRACFSPIEIAVGIICCCVPNCPHNSLFRRERPPLPTEGTGLRRLKFRTTSGSSSTSNLNPAHWMPGPKAQVNAFVTLENGIKSDEQVGNLGHNEIKVTKDYQLERGRL
jgi:hypothetical protein